MASSEITLSTTEWTQITAPGQSGICWKKEGQGVVLDHTDKETAATLPLSNTNVTTGKSKRVPLDSNSNAVIAFNPDNGADIFYALAVVGPAKIAVNDFATITSTEIEIALGRVAGIVKINKFGRVGEIDILDAPVDVWDGTNALVPIPTYTGFPTGAAEQLEIVSSDINDTAGGTGARTVEISNLLDVDKNQMPAITVTLNGTTPVSLGAGEYTRCSRMAVRTVGSSGGNIGELTVRHATTQADVFCIALPGKNGTRQLTYTVPAGKTMLVLRGNILLSRLSGGAGSSNVTINVRSDTPDAPFIPGRDIEITNSQEYEFDNGGFMVFSERIDLKVRVEDVSDSNTSISSELDAYLIDNV